jgi:hypothetical protein
MTCEKKSKEMVVSSLCVVVRSLGSVGSLAPTTARSLAVHVCCVCVYYHFNKQALFQKVALDVFGILDDIPQSH